MIAKESCQQCGQSVFVTKRMNMSTPHLLGALIVSLIIGWFAFHFFRASLGTMSGSGGGRILFYLMFGVIGLIGWIFTRYVPKERFLVKTCTRCSHSVKEKVTK